MGRKDTSPRALVCHEYALRDGLEGRFRVEPWQQECHDDQLRIRIGAAAVCHADALMVCGAHPRNPEPPFVPGREVAGEITEVGSAVRGFSKGDRVLSLCGIGGLAEEVVVDPRRQQTHRIPNCMSWGEAAGFNLSYGTAMHALRKRGELWPSESILVLGAAGGTGSAAVQIAKTIGATVLAATSGEHRCEFVRRLGADHVIDLDHEDLAETVLDRTWAQGVDVVFGRSDSERFAEAERCVAWNGRMLVVGSVGGGIPSPAIERALRRGVSVIGVAYAMSAVRNPARTADDFAWLFDSFERGAVRPRIDSVFPLDKAADALRQVRLGGGIGKVVVETQR